MGERKYVARVSTLTLAVIICACVAAPAQHQSEHQSQRQAQGVRAAPARTNARLTGVYRLNPERSDKLYTVVSGASSTLPFGEQQRFFIDLTARLTPPDQLAIERRGELINIASSRAPRTAFRADGRERVERTADGAARVWAAIEGDGFVMMSRAENRESYRVTFTPIEGGRALRVTRHITSRELSQPVVIQSLYDKISDVAQWGIYGEPAGGPAIAAVVSQRGSDQLEQDQAEVLRRALDAWIGATNARDIRWQMSFYAPKLAAFYLTRNTPREAVRTEKARIFGAATLIDINAAEPEIVFLEGGTAAIMRFRKRYRIEGGRHGRRGEVIQELRWRRTGDGWKIYSERDIRVIR
jgi:ketosteroid isomerase-like protein